MEYYWNVECFILCLLAKRKTRESLVAAQRAPLNLSQQERLVTFFLVALLR